MAGDIIQSSFIENFDSFQLASQVELLDIVCFEKTAKQSSFPKALSEQRIFSLHRATTDERAR